jgi:RNA polymerase sigma factor (sigma-70 family)
MTPGERNSRIARFFRKESARLVGYVRGRIDDTADRDGEDVVQDVLLGIFSRPDPALPIGNLTGYVYQALRNRMVDAFRGRGRPIVSLEGGADPEEGSLAEVLPDPDADLGEEIIRRESMRRFFDALASLEPDEQSVVIETELEGRTFRDLAAEWDVPIGTLLARKSRALGKIRAMLAD